MKMLKKLALAGVLTGVLLNTTGCEYLELRSEIKQLNKTIENLQAQNKTLKEQIEGLTVTEVAMETSLYAVEGETVPSFHTIDGQIKFPNKLQIPYSKEDINNSNIMVGSMFKYTPSDNWLVRLKGATLEVSHPSRIWGTIKAVSVDEPVPEPQMKPLLQGFFKGFPATTIEYRKIFMEDQVVGLIAKAKIPVNKKEHVVNVGFMTRGEYGQLFLFDYEDNKTGVQQELIDLLISSGTFADSKVKLE